MSRFANLFGPITFPPSRFVNLFGPITLCASIADGALKCCGVISQTPTG